MAKKGPLKIVVREFVVERKRYLAMPAYDMYEELECGHVIRKPKDLYGEYHAEKRRCTQCAAQQSAHPTPESGDTLLAVESNSENALPTVGG